jgi:putative Tad-like protein involved in Flp pilus assembly
MVMFLAIFTMIGALGLTCDMAVMYINWQAMQRAADEAVLSGAGWLNGTDSSGDSKAIATATTYATNNGILTTEIAGGAPTVNDANHTISITVNRTVPHIFAQVLGIMNAPIQVTATAGIQPITGAGGDHLVPFTFVCASPPCTGTAPGSTFGLPGDSVKASPGNWGGLDFSAQDSSGGYTGSNYANKITDGYGGSTPILMGTTDVDTTTGNDVNTQGGSAVAARYADGTEVPNASDPSVLTDPNDPRVIIIPMVASLPNGKKVVDITGFLTALIVPEPGQGNNPTQFYAEVVSTSDSYDVANGNGPVTGTTKAVLLR